MNDPMESAIKSVVLRIGGLHIEMSFLGCIGNIMAGSGLEDVLELAYAKSAIRHMLSGKAVARAIRGHFLVDAAFNNLLVRDAFSLPADIATTEMLRSHEQEEELMNEEEPLEKSVPTETNAVQDKDLEQAWELYNKVISGKIALDKACLEDILKRLLETLTSKKNAMQSNRTAVLWIQYMHMVDIVRRFLKAERTGNWDLHL